MFRADSKNFTPGHLDPLGFWGLIVGALGLLAALGFGIWSVRQRQVKTLDWSPMFRLPILATNIESMSRLAITWDNTKLKDPHYMSIRIGNTGTVSIGAGDYLKPLKVAFGSGTVYDVTVADPQDLGIQIDEVSYPVSLVSLSTLPTLNKGNYFDLNMVSDGSVTAITVTSKIVDETRPGLNASDKIYGRNPDWRFFVGIPVFFGLSIGIGALIGHTIGGFQVAFYTVFLVGMPLLLLTSIGSSIRYRRQSRMFEIR